MNDLNKLVDLANKYSVNFSIRYAEYSQSFEDLEMSSAAKEEEFYRKKVGSIEAFIEDYEEHMHQLKVSSLDDEKCKYFLNQIIPLIPTFSLDEQIHHVVAMNQLPEYKRLEIYLKIIELIRDVL